MNFFYRFTVFIYNQDEPWAWAAGTWRSAGCTSKCGRKGSWRRCRGGRKRRRSDARWTLPCPRRTCSNSQQRWPGRVSLGRTRDRSCTLRCKFQTSKLERNFHRVNEWKLYRATSSVTHCICVSRKLTRPMRCTLEETLITRDGTSWLEADLSDGSSNQVSKKWPR